MEKKKVKAKTSTRIATNAVESKVKVIEDKVTTKISVPNISGDMFSTALEQIKSFAEKNSKLVSIVGYTLIAIAAFALVDLFVQYLNNGYSIAVVDGVRISKTEYEKRLEQLYDQYNNQVAGEEISTQLIDETIFKNAAIESNITVSDDEVNAIVKQNEEQLGGQDALNEGLKKFYLTLDDFKERIKTDIISKKVVTQNIKVSDEDLKSFYEQNGSLMFPNEVTTDPKDSTKQILPDFETKKAEIKSMYLNQRYIQNRDTWLTEKKKSVPVQNNFTTVPSYGLFKASINLIQSLKDAITKSK